METNFAGLGVLSRPCNCQTHACSADRRARIESPLAYPAQLVATSAVIAAALAPARDWVSSGPSGVDRRWDRCLEASLGEWHSLRSDRREPQAGIAAECDVDPACQGRATSGVADSGSSPARAASKTTVSSEGLA